MDTKSVRMTDWMEVEREVVDVETRVNLLHSSSATLRLFNLVQIRFHLKSPAVEFSFIKE